MSGENKHDDGGYAHPTPSGEKLFYKPIPGMTLEDYFAGQALASMSHATTSLHGRITAFFGKPTSIHTVSPEEKARVAYREAAAMIAEKRRREAL